MVSSDKGSLGDCSQNPLGVPKVPLLQPGDTLRLDGPSVKCHIPPYRERESIPVSRTQQVHIHHNIPQARASHLTCRERGNPPRVCLFNKCNVQSTVQK